MRLLTRASWRVLAPALLCLALLANGSAHAGRVDISAVTQSASLLNVLTLHLDPSGELDPVQIADRPGQTVASQRALRFGYTSDTIWLQFRVGNDSGGVQTRWLSIGHTRLAYVDVFRLDSTGRHVEASWQGGVARPLAVRPILGKESLFPVTLGPGEEAVLVLRIRGHTMMAIEATLWDPVQYREQEAADDLRLLVPAGALMAVSLYLLIGALYRRDKPFVLLAVWLCSSVACELALKGYLFRFVLTDGGEPAIRAPLVFLCLSLALSAAFIRRFLAVDKGSVLGNVMRGVCIASLALTFIAPFGDLKMSAWAFLLCLAVLCLAYPFVLISAWQRRHPNFGLFVLALTGLWTTVVARMLVMLGFLSPSAASSATLSMVYAVGLGCAAMLGVVQRAIALNESALIEKSALLQAQRKEQARLEAAIENRTRALQDALIAADDANRAKSDFLARVSHDLRAPLTAILGYAEIIIGSGSGQADNGRIIRRSAQHLLGLLNDLIDYARGGDQPNALQPLPIYAPSLFQSIAAEGESLALRNQNRFEYQVDCDLPAVIEVDEKRLRQILINLLDNAAKFTRHGHIRFSVRCRNEDNSDESLPIVFMIEDDGPGMSPSELAHIFEPFRRLTAAESHEGLGLGLAITKQWVDCMNGRIEVESAPGQGTRMRVTVEVKPASEDALSYPYQTCREENLPELDGSGLTVWVVEDSHEIRNLLCVELRSQGFAALPIANGQDALVLLESPDTHEPDLVLTDLRMPFASGEEVLAGVRKKAPGLPVVVVTATPDAVSPEATGFSAILSKPISLLLLRQTLAKLLNLPWVSPALTPEQSALVYPDESRLADALILIRMGAISDLIDWAISLADENPAWSDFAAQARRLAEHGEMTKLLQLCERRAV